MHAAERSEGFVFRPLDDTVGRIGLIVDLDDPRAKDGATLATGALDLDGLGHDDAVDRLLEFDGAGIAPVVDRQVAEALVIGEAAGRSVFRPNAERLAHLGDVGLEGVRQTVGIGVFRQGLASIRNDDRFQFLRSHDRAHAAASGYAGVAAVMGDAGHRHQVLAGRTDDRRGLALAEFGVEDVVAFEHILAPQVGGVAQLELAFVDEQVDGFLGGAGKHDAVDAGQLEDPTESSARVGLAVDPGQGRQRHNLMTVTPRHTGSGKRPGQHDQRVFRRQGIGIAIDQPGQNGRTQIASTDEIAEVFRADFSEFDASAG